MELTIPFAPVLIPMAGLMVDVTGQIALSRLPLSFGHVRRQFLAFGLGLGAVVLMTLLVRPHRGAGLVEEASGLVMSSLTYAFFAFVFFNALNANLSSLRVRLLKELHAREPEGLPAPILLKRYGAEEILSARIDRLAAGGQLVQRGDRFFFQPKGVAVIGRFFAGLRHLLLGDAP
jgi:hypothetical protein